MFLFVSLLITCSAITDHTYAQSRPSAGKSTGNKSIPEVKSSKDIAIKKVEKDLSKHTRLPSKVQQGKFSVSKIKQQDGTVILPMKYYGVSDKLTALAKKTRAKLIEDSDSFEETRKVLLDQDSELSKDQLEKTKQNENIITPLHLQSTTAVQLTATPITSFEGPGLGMPGVTVVNSPADPTLAVGPNHIVAWVNHQYAVFDKSGNKLLPRNGVVDGNTLFTGMGNVCETTNRGDPILQYDRLADRWILSQFAFNTSGSSVIAPYFQCIAVSTTNNPTGTYYRYAIPFSGNSPSGLPDYGKLGVWTDAYYSSYNMFGGSPASNSPTGAALCASDRTKMLAGDPSATTLCAPISFYAQGVSFLPADLDGVTLPKENTRGGLFMRFSTSTGELRYLRLKPNFLTGTVTLNNGYGGAVGEHISLSPGPAMQTCNGNAGSCIAQPGTTNVLDTYGDALMYRLVYRNRGGVDSLLVTRSTDPDGAGVKNAAISWYEIRNPLGNPADANPALRPFLYQNSIFAPGTSGDRWMSSMTMDKFGNILMGYSLADALALPTGLKPSIALAGRLQSDPLNTMQGEILAVTGTGSQTGTKRWGDYTTMQIDPSEGNMI